MVDELSSEHILSGLKVSDQNIFGCYVTFFDKEEIFVSLKNKTLEIVHKSTQPIDIASNVIKCELSDLTMYVKTGHIVGKSSVLNGVDVMILENRYGVGHAWLIRNQGKGIKSN